MLAPLESPRGLVFLDSSVLASPLTDLRVVLETANEMRELSDLDLGALLHLDETVPVQGERSEKALFDLGWRGAARLLPRRARWSTQRPRLDVLGAIATQNQVPIVTITHAAVSPSLRRDIRWLRAPLGADVRTLMLAGAGVVEEHLEVTK
ncbi:hypothetical protein [Microbacterium sp. NPDC055683]